jgi:cell wall-associated NlpC family hydrolase
MSLDPRIHAVRPDLADISLSKDVVAARYVEPMLRQCVRGVVPLLTEPDAKARQSSQIRYGEFLDVFEIREDGYAWIQNRSDRTVGYIPSDDVLSEEIADLSHRINVLQTFVHLNPDITSPPVDELTLGSYVHPLGEEKNFWRLASGGYVFANHIATAETVRTSDFVFTAGRMLNVAYLCGGRTPRGLDNSGLVQLALSLAEIDSPRDCDHQRASFGEPLSRHWRDIPWRRGDLVFFTNHVGIMVDDSHLIHASATTMRVTVEPLVKVVYDQGGEVIAMGHPG